MLTSLPGNQDITSRVGSALWRMWQGGCGVRTKLGRRDRALAAPWPSPMNSAVSRMSQRSWDSRQLTVLISFPSKLGMPCPRVTNDHRGGVYMVEIGEPCKSELPALSPESWMLTLVGHLCPRRLPCHCLPPHSWPMQLTIVGKEQPVSTVWVISLGIPWSLDGG